MCWWLDRDACATTEELRDEFKISTFLESGTFRGVNLKFWSYRFERVIGVEVNRDYFWKTSNRLNGRINADVVCKDSPKFLEAFVDNYYLDERADIVLIYLDAHFYTQGEKKTKEDRWVVLRELKALAEFRNCVLAIHDFNYGKGLYGLTYDGEPLNFELVKNHLAQVNPDFSYYVNIREHCNPHTEESIVGVQGLEPDLVTLETISYHSTDRLKYRGILYCTPKPIDLKEYKLSLLTM